MLDSGENMKELKNETKYSVQEMISVVQREKNTKRSYLLANKKQAKHLPSIPSETMALFQQLGSKAKKAFSDERVLVIGFAETATAIGTVIAEAFGKDCCYIQTTREEIDPQYNIVRFQEEHSHASNQALYCLDKEEYLGKADRILFAEDEITTGRTILNFVAELKKSGYLKPEAKFAVASILDCMTEENKQQFQKNQIEFISLIKITNSFHRLSFKEKNNIENKKARPCFQIKQEIINGKMDPRTGVIIGEYLNKVQNLCFELKQRLIPKIKDKGKILILGTEEFCYPALYFGNLLEKECKEAEIKVQCTTRSPIVPWDNGTQYAVKNRCSMESIYKTERKTFVYNLKAYDQVVILTDAEESNQQGVLDLLAALSAWGNKDNCILVRWVKE